MNLFFACDLLDSHESVGAEFARDGGVSADIIVDGHTAIASKLGSYRGHVSFAIDGD
ncbi:hypothetical protein [Pseudomonas sp. PD9R]|uniref:hypothetical protein n=1 Tax=Pseudomonas sp. PD9R TaxID=2853534 RepID=UPI001C483DD4|nr:hypothetical protein [Pseudomonas sp. PD9R]MBV6823804.1 hypothetical protein [Pseudomonas sp. PD9R]